MGRLTLHASDEHVCGVGFVADKEMKQQPKNEIQEQHGDIKTM